MNKTVKAAAVMMVLAVLLFSGFMIWDNQQIYRSADNVRLAVLDAKPLAGGSGLPDFRELLKINPDVRCWLTLDGTEIDAPVVQGKDNYYYLNHDVFCENSMAGTLFLDSRNAKDFSDIYNIIYGHHMNNSLMFGDLDLYRDEAFFEKNTTGTFTLPGGEKQFETVAIMQIPDSTREIFKPSVYSDDLSELCDFIEKNSIHISDSAIAKLKKSPDKYQVTSLVTCTDGSADKRRSSGSSLAIGGRLNSGSNYATGNRLVLLVMTKYEKPDVPGGDPDKPQPRTGYDDHLVLWLNILMLSGLISVGSILCLKKRLLPDNV